MFQIILQGVAAVQRAVMTHLADVSASPVRGGVLEWMVPTGTGSPPSSSNAYAVSAMRASHRNRKKWWPQSAHRQG
jgi:hypothetical protein